ncbi:hypothetical protein WANA31_0312 [Wolbachia endosymbiont of Drosophila ananassae]|nr:hypothetical protein WANA31_0312 [Wolbachia endosymbiont of Drosophila ananassae]
MPFIADNLPPKTWYKPEYIFPFSNAHRSPNSSTTHSNLVSRFGLVQIEQGDLVSRFPQTSHSIIRSASSLIKDASGSITFSLFWSKCITNLRDDDGPKLGNLEKA